jgi:hypothetical protein
MPPLKNRQTIETANQTSVNICTIGVMQEVFGKGTVSSNTGSEKTRRCIAELWNELDFRVSGIATDAEVPEATMVAPIKMTAK